MRLIDLQVSYQALPEQARAQGMEMAASTYRHVQDLARNRAENLSRPERVAQTAQTNASPAMLADVRENRRGIQREREAVETKQTRELFLYSPSGKTPIRVTAARYDVYA